MTKSPDSIDPAPTGPVDDKFAALLARTQLTRAELMHRGLETGLEWEPWIDLQFIHIAETEAALAEADAGDFASPEDVEAMFAKYRLA